MKTKIWEVILAVMSLIIIAATSGFVGWGIGSASKEAYKLQIVALQSELEQIEKPLRLEDRFANLMETLSDDGVMKYDVDINAQLLEDDMPDTVSISLHLKEGQVVK